MSFDPGFLVLQLFAGLSRAMILFLLSSGLSLIFGVMNILNFAHATLWLFAGYLTFSIYAFLGEQFGSSPLNLVAASALATTAMVAVGVVLERLLIRRMYARGLPEQLLMTFALVLIIGDLIKLIWGVENRRIILPIEPFEMLGAFFNPYYLLIIAVGGGVAGGLWWFLHRTKYGKIVRAAVYSGDVGEVVGIRGWRNLRLV